MHVCLTHMIAPLLHLHWSAMVGGARCTGALSGPITKVPAHGQSGSPWLESGPGWESGVVV